MAKFLCVDFDALNETIDLYESSLDDFKSMISKLDKVIGTLKSSEWKSDAATAFFNSYDENWKQNMQKHILIIEHLKECLEEARKEYDSLADDAQDLELALRI